MKIVLTVTSYKSLTGSELFCYDLARQLHKLGHYVIILANDIGGEIKKRTPKGIELYHFFDHPDFKADLVINSQPQPTTYGLTFFPKAKHIQILHSHLPYEEPVISRKIDKYVAVRPEIKKHWEKKHPTLKDRIVVVRNGVDTARFNTEGTKSPRRHTVLFVGTFDHLRRDVIMDLVKNAVEKDHDLLLVLPVNPFPYNTPPKNVTVLSPQWDIEKLTKRCSETAGIFAGRTTIEGWLCGKPGLVYEVDEVGRIISKMTVDVPKNLDQFNLKYMTKQLLTISI